MFDFNVTVAISTYNRSVLIGCAIYVMNGYPQVRYVRQDKKGGRALALSRAVREARTPWTYFWTMTIL
jgi:hypothetical protein